MKEYVITTQQAGQRLDKYLKKVLPNASTGFLYKMLRKKNIKISNRKDCKVNKKEENYVKN